MEQPDQLSPSDLSRNELPMLDPVLRLLVHQANKDGLSFGITLAVGGFLVSGRLVGYKEFLDEQAKLLRRQGSEAIEVLAGIFDRVAEVLTTNEQQEEESEDNSPLPYLIHLSNARFYVPGAERIPSGEGVLWRGRLEAVDGFMVGELGPGPAPRAGTFGRT
jgi:hypothetical protein